MNVSVLLSSDLLPPRGARGTVILIGQHCVTGSDEAHTSIVNVVFDTIPCEEADVIAEQLECLEQVLPCGIIFLGVLLLHDSARQLVASLRALKDHPRLPSLLAVVREEEEKNEDEDDDDSGAARCQLLQSGTRVRLASPGMRPLFVSMPCYLKSPLDVLPFIVRVKGGKSTECVVVDVNSTRALASSGIWDSPNEVYAVQLCGVADGEREVVCVHVTFSPQFSSGRDLYDAICALLPRLGHQPQAMMVRVQSQRNHALVYQWICTSTGKDSKKISNAQWKELRELIEDGVGEKLRSLHVVPDVPIGSPQVLPSTEMACGEKLAMRSQVDALSHVDRHEEAPHLLKWAPIIALAFGAVVVAFLWSR